MFKKYYFIFLSVFFVIILFSLSIYPVGMHVVVKEKTGAKLIDESVMPGDRISIKFTHSVEKVNVTETYIVQQDKRLLLKEASYGSTGAGLPSDTSYNIIYKDDKYMIENIDKNFNNIEFITGNIPKHSIIIGDTEYPIYKLAKEGEPLSLTIESISVVNKLLIT